MFGMTPDMGYTVGGCWLLFSAACMAAPSTVQRLRRRVRRG
jgi:hypothetical protein